MSDREEDNAYDTNELYYPDGGVVAVMIEKEKGR